MAIIKQSTQTFEYPFEEMIPVCEAVLRCPISEKSGLPVQVILASCGRDDGRMSLLRAVLNEDETLEFDVIEVPSGENMRTYLSPLTIFRLKE